MNLFIFDLDGTLVDTKENIACAANYTMEKMGFSTIPFATVCSFVGDGSKRLLERCFTHHGIKDHLYQQAWDIFFDYYYNNVEQCTQLYPGTLEVLQQLHGKHHMVVLTNKPQQMADKLLKFLQIDNYFTDVIGGGDDSSKLKPNPHHLLCLVEKYNSQTSIMVGDSKVDIRVAKNAQIPSIAFTHGFGKTEELGEANFIVDSFAEFHELIKKQYDCE